MPSSCSPAGLEWAASQARRLIHDNDVERLKQLLAEYPALLSWPGNDWDSQGGLLGIATGSYGDSFDPNRGCSTGGRQGLMSANCQRSNLSRLCAKYLACLYREFNRLNCRGEPFCFASAIFSGQYSYGSIR